MPTKLFPRDRGSRGPAIEQGLTSLRQSLYALQGRGADTWHPVKVRPSLSFAMVPKPRPRRPLSESEAVEAFRRHRKMWPPTCPPAAGMGLSSSRESDAPPENGQEKELRRGFLGLPRFGAGKIRDLGALHQHECSLFAFWTVTLPPDAAREMELRGVEWAEVQDRIRRRFSEALSRRARSSAHRKAGRGRIPPWWFVVESQKSGRPHIHFCYKARWHRGSRWFLSCADLDRIIRNALEVAIGIDVDVRGAGNVQRVKIGLSNYLAKYMGKGCGGCQVALILEGGYGPGMVPHVWWGYSKEAKAEVDRNTFPIPAVLVGMLSREVWDLCRAGLATAEFIELQAAGAPTVVLGRWQGVEGLSIAIGFLAHLAEQEGLIPQGALHL